MGYDLKLVDEKGEILTVPLNSSFVGFENLDYPADIKLCYNNGHIYRRVGCHPLDELSEPGLIGKESIPILSKALRKLFYIREELGVGVYTGCREKLEMLLMWAIYHPKGRWHTVSK